MYNCFIQPYKTVPLNKTQASSYLIPTNQKEEGEIISLNKLAKISTLALIIGAFLTSAILFGICAPLELTTTTEKTSYFVREKLTCSGNVSFNGSPVSNAQVALEMHSQNDIPMVYRAVTLGNLSDSWELEITDIGVWDLNLPPNPLDTVKVGETVKISATVTNPQPTQREHVYIAISVFDGNMVPLRPYMAPDNSILPQSSLTIYGTLTIPTWTYAGMATIYVNAYDNVPSNNGVPYALEESAQFYISRTEQGLLGYSSLESTPSPPQSGGAYNLTLGLPPTLTPGTYPIYTTARYRTALLIYKASDGTTFDILYVPSPPTASFVWTPREPYPNMTVTFDASSSSAEGHNDTIIQYKWDWGDGTPQDITTTPIMTHKFMASQQYIVTLNVTDQEGLWSLTQKPISIKPTDPSAAFTWTPTIARINRTVTFNASTSLPGWSIKTASPAPIVNYVWNFGDGSGNFTVPIPILDHTYFTPGNFTVLLEVIDSEGQRDSISHIVQVQNITSPVYDINGDGKVDIKDIAIVAKAYGSEPGDPNWNPIADITGPTGEPDGKVDVRDIALVAKHFGEVY